MAESVRIDSYTWRFEDDFVRFFLLEGENQAVMIDSGANCPDALQMAQALTDKPIMLLNTHGDGDHTSGTDGFGEIHMHALDYVCCEVNIRYPHTVLAEVNDGDVIELGNRPIRIIHIPGHTQGSIAILDVNARVLYAGDSVQKGHIYMFGNKRQPELYEQSLDKLIALQKEYDWIYASHDEYVVPGDYAEKVRVAWKKVRNGEAKYELMDMFGTTVKSYTTDVCGFYID